MLALALFPLAGCASLSAPESAWQALHLADASQTLSLVDSPCFHERDPFTVQLIGRHPSQDAAAAWAVLAAVAHYGVTRWLDRSDAPTWFKRTVIVSDLALKAVTVVRNQRRGIRAFASNVCHR